MLSAVVKSFIKLTAIMLSVVILSVAAPFSTQSYYCNENCASEKKFYHFNNLECLTQKNISTGNVWHGKTQAFLSKA
jgi:hypothetical protein